MKIDAIVSSYFLKTSCELSQGEVEMIAAIPEEDIGKCRNIEISLSRKVDNTKYINTTGKKSIMIE
ncbi:MAG: hypothetical protein IKW81_10010 [Pseudobutyrivibrio sp.]|nr:hypothetical protein [Pseudobutyrivibrio sp.]